MKVQNNPPSAVNGHYAPGEDQATRPWCAIRVRSRAEKSANLALSVKGYETYLPLYQKQAQWSDRASDFNAPLFPGYVFCRYDPCNKSRIVVTPGVVEILGFGGQIAVITEAEIEAVKTAIESGLPTEPCSFLREGELVRITAGVLAGTEGILVRAKSKYRIVISVFALCRSVAVEIDREAVRSLACQPGIA